MATLIFLLTFLLLLILIVRLIIKIFLKKQLKSTLLALILVIVAYSLVWLIFYFNSRYKPVKLGTDVCFDDWCASVTGIYKSKQLQNQFSILTGDSTFIVLKVRISNHARGIAQKPSEPRIHIIDEKGHSWANSLNGQQLFEKKSGTQAALDERLALHQTIETRLVFAIPANSTKLMALIEEGPFITKLLFPYDELIFEIK